MAESLVFYVFMDEVSVSENENTPLRLSSPTIAPLYAAGRWEGYVKDINPEKSRQEELPNDPVGLGQD